MAELFGFRFEKIKDTKSQEKFTVPPADDGTAEIAGGGFFGQVLDVDGRDKSELDLKPKSLPKSIYFPIPYFLKENNCKTLILFHGSIGSIAFSK